MAGVAPSAGGMKPNTMPAAPPRSPGSDPAPGSGYHGSVMRKRQFRGAFAVPLLVAPWLLGCVPEEGVQTSTPAAWEAVAERMPENLGAFRRGTPVPLADAAEGREFPFATGSRAIAGYVQLRATAAPDAAADLTQQLQVVTQAGPPHRRLRERARPTPEDALHCAELDGSFGRTPVDGLACSAVVAGHLVRIRLTMQRRDGRLDQARDFARGVIDRLNGR